MLFCLISCQSGSQIWFPVVGEMLSATFHHRQLASPVILRWASVGPLLWVVWAKNWFVNDDMYWLSGGCGFEIPLEVGHMTGPCRFWENLRVWDQFLFLKQSDQFPINVPACVERCFLSDACVLSWIKLLCSSQMFYRVGNTEHAKHYSISTKHTACPV